MVKWPKSKGKQAALAFFIALLAAIWMFTHIELVIFSVFISSLTRHIRIHIPMSMRLKLRSIASVA
jgi:hypothetical protein